MNHSARIASILGLGILILFSAQHGYISDILAMMVLLSLTLLIRFVFVN